MSTTQFRPCALIPTFDNPATLRSVVERVRQQLPDVILIDDGSGPEGRAVAESVGRLGLAHVVRRAKNGGKGAAVKTGFSAASELGFTHALQVDADGQHDIEDIPAFVEAARQSPRALVLGCPKFDQTAPLGRRLGRQLTVSLVHLETGGTAIADPMCGFRVYPLARVLRLRCGDFMDFDIEVAVRLVWQGTPVVNLPTKVRYIPAAEGGISHFRMFDDNVRITWLHIRLVATGLLRLFSWPMRAFQRRILPQ